jgi:hypothetical protein
VFGRLFRRPVCAACQTEPALRYVESATGVAHEISLEVRPFPLRICRCGVTAEAVLKPGVLQDALIAQRLFVWFGGRDRDTCKRCDRVIETSATRGLAEFDLQLSPGQLKTINIRARLPSRACPSCGATLVDADATFDEKSRVMTAWEQLLGAARRSSPEGETWASRRPRDSIATRDTPR